MDVDPKAPIPLYFQVKSLIMERIASGTYLPGDRLPTEHELCATYGISRTPVHRALAELATEGVIVRRRRHGTMVNPHWTPPPNQGALRVLIASEEWAPHIHRHGPGNGRLNVVAVGYPNLHSHITRSVAEGQAPDLMVVDSVWVPEFAHAGILAPLDELAPSWIASDHADFVPRFVHNGQAVALAAEVNVAGLWYCRQTVSRLDLEPPHTWQELSDVGSALMASEPDVLPLAVPLGTGAAETTTYCLVALLASNGALVVDEGCVVLDSPNAVATLDFITSLIDRGVVHPQSVAYEWDRAPELVASGRAAMSIGGTYEAPVLARTAGIDLTDLEQHFGFAPLPYGPDGAPATVLGGMAYAIPKQSRRRAEAMRLLRSLAEPEPLMALARVTGTLPGRRSGIATLAEQLPVLRAASKLINTAVPRPQTTAYNRVSIQVQLMVESVVLGRTTPADAVARAADHISAITGLPVMHRGTA